jgi:signal transduction histidine kinase
MSMNILIVDDNATNLKLLGAVLDAEGHRALRAKDGVEALEILERESVDAVISDILMPRMDGYRLCYEVRGRANFNATPFVVYTSTYISPSDEKTALGLGADIFLRKPAPAADIVKALEQAKRNAALRPGGVKPAMREADRLKEYSERLVEKLEKRNAELHEYAEMLKRNEGEVTKSREQLRVLAERLQAAREEERLRIARELHDGMGGMLMGIEIGLTWLQTKLDKKAEPVERERLLEKTVELDKLVRDTANRVRQLCTELRPSILDNLGLGAALEWQAREFEERSAIKCDFTIEGEITGHRDGAATGVFRIFQEILTNVARHAHASKVVVRISQSDSKLLMRIKDNGIGIRPEQVSQAKSLGLLGMQERAEFLGGSIRIEGIKGKGTTVSVTIPVAHSSV